MTNISLIQVMVLLWQLKLIDSLTFIQFCINCGTQYGTIVAAEATVCIDDIGPGVILAPLSGLGTSYKYVRAAQGAMERRSRIAMIASLLSTSFFKNYIYK